MIEQFTMKDFDEAVLKGEATWWQMELPSGDVFFGNEKTDMLGYKETDFKHYKDFTNLLHKEDHNKAMKAMKDHLEGKNPVYETIYRIKTKNGEYIRFYDCGQITEKEGESIKIIGFVLKIGPKNNIERMKKFKEFIIYGDPSMIDLVKKIK